MKDELTFFSMGLFIKMINSCNLTKDYTEVTSYLLNLTNNQILEILDHYDFEIYFVDMLKNAGINKYVGSMLYVVLEKKIKSLIKEIGFYKTVLMTRIFINKIQEIKI